jgi:LmbE family N-acetylglucosaminyl deacetylase
MYDNFCHLFCLIDYIYFVHNDCMTYHYESYICAFGPHPDDVDVGCGGTLWHATQQGKKVIIVDCSSSMYATRGTEQERLNEAQKA